MHLASVHLIKLHRFSLNLFLLPRSSSKTLFEANPRLLHHFLEDFVILSSFQVYSRILLHPYSRELANKFKFIFKFRRTFYLSSFQDCLRILIAREALDDAKFSRLTLVLPVAEVIVCLPV